MMRSFVYLLMFLPLMAIAKDNNREQNFNDNWLFSLELAPEAEAFASELDDSQWRQLSLPHDWSVEFPFDSVKGEGCTAYLPGGLGWYRKHFDLNIGKDQKAFIYFDGVYNNSEYWINGHKLGVHPYGYSPFYFDITPYLKDEDNVIAVKVDRTRYADSRWYPGAGIYRDVELIITADVYVPVWGAFVTTPVVSEKEASLDIQITLRNDTKKKQQIRLITEIFTSEGEQVGKNITEVPLNAHSKKIITEKPVIENPKLWGVDNPQLYEAVISVIKKGETVDRYSTTFGIRSILFDANKGFFLNGENMKIKGVCLHHDGGLVGAAVPKDVWKRRLQILKDGGCNAIRISHNPASEEFLELCDEMGFLVQDEFFDEWDFPKDKRMNQWERHDDYISRGYAMNFQDWAEKDLKNTMLAHRNHPSVFQWSIGNEIEWTYPRNRQITGFFNNMGWSGNYFWSPPPYSPERIKEEYNKLEPLEYEIGPTAQKLANWTRELDTTRPVIANCILPSASFVTGYADALDIVGFSYRRVMYDYARENYPDKVVMGTENLGQWHEWKAIEERDFISGTFLWTGIDYMGEANEQWPKKGIESGLLDQAGFKKPSYYMYKTLWAKEPVLYICSNSADESNYVADESGKVLEKNPGAWEHALWEWYDVNHHWKYADGEEVIVEIISGCEEVELFLNDRSLGTKKLAEFPDRIYKWALPFEAGTLKAVGKTDDGSITEQVVTAGEPAALKVTIDKESLKAGSTEVAHLEIQLVDKDGNPVTQTEKVLEFSFDEALVSLGVDNGNLRNLYPYQGNKMKTHKGKALCIVRGIKQAKNAAVIIKGKGLKQYKTVISSK